jgi:hypothetical protein
VLSGYIEEGLRQNVDVRIALARIKEARAFHGMAESAYYPIGRCWPLGRGATRESGGGAHAARRLGRSTAFPGNLPYSAAG